MFGIGETELVIIVVFAFMLFGPDKLPGMGRTLGRVLRQFREASDGFTEVVQTNIMDPASEELEKSPKQRRREAAELQDDADVERPEGAAEAEASAPRRETFAERKARLKAEREAAAAAAGTEQAEPEDIPDDEPPFGADLDDDLPEEAEAPRRTTAASLYDIPATRKSSRSKADHAEPETVAAPDTLGEEDEGTKA